jgi:O-antigen/teichoic acid export membrane protein
LITKSFIKSSFVYSVIGALPLASSVLLLPFYTNYLTKEQFGYLSLYIAFTGIIQIFVNYGLEHYSGITYIENKENVQRTKEHIGTVVSLLLIIGAVFLIFFLITGDSLFSYYSSLTKNRTLLEFYPWGIMSVLTAIFNSLFKTYVSLLIYQQRVTRYFWMNIYNFLLTICISLAGLFYLPYSLNGPMYGRLLSGVGIFLLAFYFFLREYGLAFKPSILRGLASFCSPLLFSLVLYWIIGNLDKYIIAYFLSNADVAIFSFAVSCTFLLDFFHSGLSAAIVPKVLNVWRDQEVKHSTVEVNRYFNGYTAITLLILPLFLLVLPLLIPLVVRNHDYYIAFTFLPVLSASYALGGLRAYFNAPIMLLKKTKVLPRIYLISSVIQIALTIYLIKHFGIIGAAWAFFIVRFVQLILLYLESKRFFQYSMNKTKQLFLPIAYMAIVLLSEQFVNDKYKFVTEIGQMIIIFSLVFWVYRREIVLVLKPYFEKKQTTNMD